MRELGTLQSEDHAERLVAHLILSGIAARGEEENSAWTIWVRDDEDLPRAREELAQFEQAPDKQQYIEAAATVSAARVERARQLRREAAQRAGGDGDRGGVDSDSLDPASDAAFHWRPPRLRRCRAMLAIALLSVIVTAATSFGSRAEPVMTWLSFCELQDAPGGAHLYPIDSWKQIRQGQIWRTLTPILLHFDIGHLAFNLIGLYFFGGQVEDRRGTSRFVILVLLIGVGSNVAQYVVEQSPNFGGLSGVDYGLFGYVWMKSRYARSMGLYVHTSTVVLMLVFLVICVLREVPSLADALGVLLPHVANTAHVVGLLLGVLLAIIPIWLRPRPATV